MYRWPELVQLPNGEYRVELRPCFYKRWGWLTVRRSRRGWVNLIWTTHRHFNLPFCHAVGVLTLNAEGELLAYLKSRRGSPVMAWNLGDGQETSKYREAVAEANRITETLKRSGNRIVIGAFRRSEK